MDDVSLLRAILDDPDEDAARLKYADWLEANGKLDRATWIRVSCEYAHVRYGDDKWSALLDRVIDSFNHCRPAWWENITNVDQKNDRGMFRFVVGAARSARGPTPVKRLGKVAWLGQALDEGWLQRVELMWDDGELAKLVAKWKDPASRIPLLVRPAPQIDDEGLRSLLALPQLEGVDLEAHVLRNPVVKELATYSNIHDLTVEFRLVDSGTVDAMLYQVGAMRGLRRLHLKGHENIDYGNRPNDSDLLCLSSLPTLKRLYLADSPAVTDSGIEELQRALPSLIIRRV
jgi:uncharacterized protein (TIGR02996 family)